MEKLNGFSHRFTLSNSLICGRVEANFYIFGGVLLPQGKGPINGWWLGGSGAPVQRIDAANEWRRWDWNLVPARESGLWWVTGSFWAGQSDMFGRGTGRWAGAIAGLISDRTWGRRSVGLVEPLSAPSCSVLGATSTVTALRRKNVMVIWLGVRWKAARGDFWSVGAIEWEGEADAFDGGVLFQIIAAGRWGGMLVWQEEEGRLRPVRSKVWAQHHTCHQVKIAPHNYLGIWHGHFMRSWRLRRFWTSSNTSPCLQQCSPWNNKPVHKKAELSLSLWKNTCVTWIFNYISIRPNWCFWEEIDNSDSALLVGRKCCSMSWKIEVFLLPHLFFKQFPSISNSTYSDHCENEYDGWTFQKLPISLKEISLE